ncbi:MAG: J domain-containing protein [Polymorphobacter sp.]
MARSRRTDDWGFPRWRPYGSGGAAVEVRLCDRHGCSNPGDRPAPKAPNRPERWYFCQAHAAEYNQGWDYFAGLTPEEAAAREASEQAETKYKSASHWEWGGAGDGSRSRAELDALAVLGLDSDADMEAVKAAWRTAAKTSHPDVAGKDAAAADRFRAVQAAWQVLSDADAIRAKAPGSA